MKKRNLIILILSLLVIYSSLRNLCIFTKNI